jgi:CRP/FNR family transcriptional regulator, cyclic AMP receptor protein
MLDPPRVTPGGVHDLYRDRTLPSASTRRYSATRSRFIVFATEIGGGQRGGTEFKDAVSGHGAPARGEVTTVYGTELAIYHEPTPPDRNGGNPIKIPGVFYNAKSFKDVSAGTVIFQEGASGADMFGILEGEVELRLPNGVVHRLGPDDTFGEMAIIDNSPRSATAVAVTDTKLAVIDRHRFLFLVQETPMFAVQVMSNIAERLRAATSS